MSNMVYRLRMPYIATTIINHRIRFLLPGAELLLLFALWFLLPQAWFFDQQSGPNHLFQSEMATSESFSSTSLVEAGGRGAILFPALLDDSKLLYPSTDAGDGIASKVHDETIYTLKDVVEKRPELVWMVYPELPNDLPSGSGVVLDILVGYDGRVLEADFGKHSQLNSTLLDNILKSASGSIFKPGLVNGKPVKCWVEFPLSLTPEA